MWFSDCDLGAGLLRSVSVLAYVLGKWKLFATVFICHWKITVAQFVFVALGHHVEVFGKRRLFEAPTASTKLI